VAVDCYGLREWSIEVKRTQITPADFQSDPTLKQHANRSREVARALDAKQESLPYAQVFTSMQFGKFLTQLTPKRFEILRLASKGGLSISDLALASHRDPSAVSRDVASLSKLGLVRVESISNQGHGHKKIVTPVATTISIQASIGLN
jgi:predicted transcriptional regulator